MPDAYTSRCLVHNIHDCVLGVSEEMWRSAVVSAPITGVSDSTYQDDLYQTQGGHIVLHMSGSPTVKYAHFVSEHGSSAYHLAHLAFYLIDRILGVCSEFLNQTCQVSLIQRETRA